MSSGNETPDDRPAFLTDPEERPGPPPQMAEKPRSNRKGLTVLVALFALAVFAGVVWYAYDQGMRAGSEVAAPLIKAEGSPAKVRPEQPGGMAIPHQDKTVYQVIQPDDQKDATVERLLPPPETPLPKPEPEKQPEAAPAPSPAPASSSPIPPASTPKPESSSSTAPPPAEKPKENQPVKVDEAPKVVAKAEPKPVPKPEPAAKPAPKAASKPTGKYRIQIAAVRSEDAARKEWNRVSKANSELLSGLSMTTQRVDLGAGKGVFFRIQAGSVSEKAARDICAGLKSRNQACIVVKP